MSANDIFAGCLLGNATKHTPAGNIPHRITNGDLLFFDKIDCIVFSAFKNTLSDTENLANDFQVEKYLINNSISYKNIIGMYKGNKELSFIVKLGTATREYEVIEGLINKCMAYKQESILLLEKENGQQKRPAWILPLKKHTTLSPRYMGLLQEVPQEEAVLQDSYTHDYQYNKYFIIK